MAKGKFPLKIGEVMARVVIEHIGYACEKIEVAGSVRRKKPRIGDIELVCVPVKLGNGVSLLDEALAKWLATSDRVRTGSKWGPKARQLELYADQLDAWVQVELYITTPEQWGYILAFRTGPKEFNMKWLTQEIKGGVLPDDYYFEGGWLFRNGRRVPTPNESDIFALIGGWIPPEDRNPQILQAVRRQRLWRGR
ncbi:MAG: hypothetical protein FOGNACKC_00853 [Anaerolineae bacterium]|nr:hypothetical protein [Anaerolineae bacterium]